MTITVTCQCGKQLKVPETHAGKAGRCPACGEVLHLPSLGADVIPTKAQSAAAASPPQPPPLPSHTPPPPIPQQPPNDEYPDLAPEELPHHNGDHLPRGVDFFADPPPEIGPLVSGFSTLQRDVEPMSESNRLVLLLVVTTVCFFAGFIVVLLTGSVAAVFLAIALAAIGFLIAFFTTRFAHTCTYVGRDGAAELKCNGSREKIVERVFLFRHATELRTAQTRHYVNGAYSGTQYDYNWTDHEGRVSFRLHGRYNSEVGNPKAKDPFHFALATEVSWSLYLLDRAADELNKYGSIEFGLKGRDWIRLGAGFVVLCTRGEEIELRGEDIARIRIEQGVVSILEPGAKEGWFSSVGVYKFNYQDLGNAKFFLFLLDKLVGIR